MGREIDWKERDNRVIEEERFYDHGDANEDIYKRKKHGSCAAVIIIIITVYISRIGRVVVKVIVIFSFVT